MVRTDDAYWQDRRRWDLAWRFLAHGARPGTITRFTGLSAARQRKLLERYPPNPAEPARLRRRGKAPYRIERLLRSRGKRQEVLAFAQLWIDFYNESATNQRQVLAPPVARGECLLEAFERFSAGYPNARLALEEAMLVQSVLAHGGEFAFAMCTACHALALSHGSTLKSQTCNRCESGLKAIQSKSTSSSGSSVHTTCF